MSREEILKKVNEVFCDVFDNESLIINENTNQDDVYINLTQSVARNQIYAKNYRVQLSGGRSDDNPVHFYFDNIKVIYQ